MLHSLRKVGRGCADERADDGARDLAAPADKDAEAFAAGAAVGAGVGLVVEDPDVALRRQQHLTPPALSKLFALWASDRVCTHKQQSEDER